MKKAIIVIVIVAVLGGGAFALMKHNDKNDTDSKSGTTSSSNTEKETEGDDSTTAQSASQATGTNFTINANDESADVMTLNVKKGDKISVTFKVDSNGVYHGGLQFKSDTVSSKPIQPGDSDTVTFTADKSFDFTPYWYQSDVKKDYLISVKVQ